ncbi:MAG: aspartate aminotransferase family protein [Robiginitalea sp.]|uniref:aspartate aminotransferase family protein n=2 Tax=Robiginitalea sp. TaxID=1902411 RepID=UPI003C750F4B
MPHNIQPLLNKEYIKAASSKGIYIYDENGKEYIDGSSGAITCSLGHGHEEVIELIKKQAEKLIYVYRSQFGSHESERLATQLFEKSPYGRLEYSFFVNSGSEAIETAMKIAYQYWQEKGCPNKNQFITRQKSYHGITLGALSLSGHALRRERFEKVLHTRLSLNADLENDILEAQTAELIELIEKTGSDNIAAFVAEPIVGAAGTALAPQPGYYERIREICDTHSILFIADEVMTGLGRTGKWFGLEHWSAQADIVAIGKSLGAGYAPIAATLLTSEIIDPIKKGSGFIMSGHTYSGHPLSCAIASKVIEVIEQEQLIAHVDEMGNYLKKQLESLKQSYTFIQTVRGKGLLIGIEFDPEIEGLAKRCLEICYENGLLVYPSVGGKYGRNENGLLIAPPFIITKSQADAMVQILQYSLDTLKINDTKEFIQ